MIATWGALDGVTAALGWALVHSLWQCAAVGALSAAAIALSRTSQARYLVGLAGLAAMVILPLVTFATGLAPAADTAPAGAEASLVTTMPGVVGGTMGPMTASRWMPSGENLALLVDLWLAGVALFGMRAVGGLWWIGRLRRSALEAPAGLAGLCRAVARSLRLARPVRCALTRRLDAPAVIGWLRPLVLFPVSALTGLSREQLRLVLAHELAHVKRWDALVNLAQVGAETLLFYHPAVWWLSGRVRREREDCCDDLALAAATGGSLEYARALAQLEEARQLPQLAMAVNRGPLSRRIERILGVEGGDARRRSLQVALSVVCLTLALLAASHLPTTEAAEAEAAEAAAPSGSAAGEVAEPPSSRGGDSYLSSLRAVGLEPDAQQLMAMKIHGVTAAEVGRFQEAGLRLDADLAIALAIHGATPDFVDQLREFGFAPSADEVVAMRVHGVATSDVRSFRRAGFEPSIDDLIALRVHGANPEFAAALAARGLAANLDDVIAARIHGITLEFVDRARTYGFDPLDLDQLIQLKRLGLVPEEAVPEDARKEQP